MVAVGEHRAQLRPARGVRRAQAREVLEAGRHRLLDERVDAALEALARHRGLEVEERGDHGEVGLLAVEHGPPVVVPGDERGLELVDVERARVLVGRPGRDADEAHPVRPVAHPEGEVDVPARADDDGLHGAAPPTIAGSARACPRPAKWVRSNRMNMPVPRRRRLPPAAILLAAALFGAGAAPAALASPAKPEQPGRLKILVPLSTAAVPFLLLADEDPVDGPRHPGRDVPRSTPRRSRCSRAATRTSCTRAPARAGRTGSAAAPS